MSARAGRVSGQIAGYKVDATAERVVIFGEETIPVVVTLTEEGANVALNGGREVRLQSTWRPGQPVMEGRFGKDPFAVKISPRPEGFRLRLRGVTATLIVTSPRAAARRSHPRRSARRSPRRRARGSRAS